MKLEAGGRWLAVALVLVAAAGVSGQSAAPQTRDDVLPALLAEVRGLRAAMEQMASAGPRVQLFASRLQLQEARINNMIRRLEIVRDRLLEAQREYANALNQKKQLEAAVEGNRRNPTPAAVEELRQAEFMLREASDAIAGRKAALDRYTAEESQLMADLTTEQGRWNAINQQLDELERALAKR